MWDHNNVKIFWQNNPWVDIGVVNYIENNFVEHKYEVTGEDAWVIFFCGNLSADPYEYVKIYGANKALLFCLPPKMTNFLQPIDSGIGRSIHVEIGNYLGEWFMVDKNMARWEDKMTAYERRMLMIIFESKALIHILAKYQYFSRTSDFERTGCIINMLVNDEHDNKIRPQGMTVEILTVPKVFSDREIQGSAVKQQTEGQYGEAFTLE